MAGRKYGTGIMNLRTKGETLYAHSLMTKWSRLPEGRPKHWTDEEWEREKARLWIRGEHFGYDPAEWELFEAEGKPDLSLIEDNPGHGGIPMAEPAWWPGKALGMPCPEYLRRR